MIREPVFEDPASLESLMQRAAARLAARERLPDLELAMIIEGYQGKILPGAINDYLVQHFRGEIRAVKGPKPQSDAAKDFRFGPAHNLYRRALRIFQYFAKRSERSTLRRRRIVNSGPSYQDPTLSPGDRALNYAKEKLGDEFDLRSERSLANEFSKRQRAIEAREFPEDEPNAHPTDEPEPKTSLP
jgi:hypothetical protein